MQLWLLLRRICCRFKKLKQQSRTQESSRLVARVSLLATLLVFVLVLTSGVFYTRADVHTRVYAATSSTLNYQARLQNANGNVVRDGNYHVEFKLYSAATGGTALWTETRTTGSLVRVVNGYMSVQLGSVNTLPTDIDWSQEMWLTMNVGGDGASPVWDGEMTPRIKLTAVPYAFRSDLADRLKNGTSSLTANDIFQTSPLNPQILNSSIAGLRFNQTGNGGLLQLQADGADVFTVDKSGNGIFSGALRSDGALTVASGGASIGGGLNNNSGSITNAGSITGIGTNITAAAGLIIASGGAGDLVLDSASNKLVIAGSDTTLQRIGTGAFTFDISDGGTTSLVIGNSGTGVANLNLADGALQIGGVTVLTNGRALQNVTASTDILTSGILGTARGGTGVNGSSATNGQLLIGNGSGFSLGMLANNGGLTITPGAGTLGLAVTYGSIANTAAQGNQALSFTGSGNLAGTVSGTAGGGFTSNTLNTVMNPTFTTSVTSPLFTNAGALTLSTTGANNLTISSGSALVALGASTIQTTNGLAFNLNNAAATTFSINNAGGGIANFNLVNGGLQTAGTLRLSNAGVLQNITGLTITSGGASITGGINNNSGGITNTGSIAGATTITASGAIAAATTTNTINGLIINNGALTGVTTLTASSTISAPTINASGASGVFQRNGVAGQTISCGNNQYLNQVVVSGGIITGNGGCNGVGLSDERLKTNVSELDGSILDQLANIRTVNFDFICSDQFFTTTNTNCDSSRQTGVMAQELARIFPELTYMGEDGYYRVKYDALAIYNLRATTEIAKRLDSEGNAKLNNVETGGVLRLNSNGILQNINGLNIVANGASVRGGLNNNGGGISNAGAVTGVTTLSGQSIQLDAPPAGNLLTLRKDGNGVFTIFNDGAVEVRTNSSAAFAVKSASGLTHFNIDTNGNLVSIGSGNADDKAILLVLDGKNGAEDPAGRDGAQYYNAALKRFRCFEAGNWKDCISSTTARQSADQASGSSDLVDAKDLKLSVAANESYTFEAAINVDVKSAQSGLRYTFTAPAGASISIVTSMPTGPATASTCNISSSGQICTVTFSDAYRGALIVRGQIMNGASAGILQFKFSQNTAMSDQVITVKKGSSLGYIRTDQ